MMEQNKFVKYKKIAVYEQNKLLETCPVDMDEEKVDKLLVNVLIKKYKKIEVSQIIKMLSHLRFQENNLQGHKDRAIYRTRLNRFAHGIKKKRVEIDEKTKTISHGISKILKKDKEAIK